MTPAERAQIDQSAQSLADSIATLYHAIYTTLIDKGFGEQIALALLCAYIQANPLTLYRPPEER